ncbi:MAG TPA: hypothetical protein VFZ34_33365 [Blastocatellia bacterium]|nr:hypothetical protein [Blastocatellia bacterium]
MLISTTDASDYPKFKDYLYNRFPNIVASKTIVKNLLKYGNLSESAVRAALYPGMPPLLKVVPIGTEEGVFSSDLGKLERNQPGIIKLSTRMVSGFNEGPWYQENFFPNNKGQDVPVVGGVLLHFLCHWGNFITGRSEGGVEMGDEFEVATYGHHVYYYPSS